MSSMNSLLSFARCGAKENGSSVFCRGAVSNRNDIMSKEIFNPSSPPESPLEGVTISHEESQYGWNIFHVTPHDVPPQQRVFYFHGGAFVMHMLERHWDFIGAMAKETNSEVIVPAYPLIPYGGNVATVPAQVAELVAHSTEASPSTPLTLMGDSAGGNLAIVATMINRDYRQLLPHKNILISPWLDLALPDADLEGIDAPNMNIGNLRGDAEMWRGAWPLDHPYVSPVRDTLHNLGKIAIFCGTADVLNPGCRRFVEKAWEAPGTQVDYYEYPNARHSHALGTTAAGAHARALIYSYIQEEMNG